MIKRAKLSNQGVKIVMDSKRLRNVKSNRWFRPIVSNEYSDHESDKEENMLEMDTLPESKFYKNIILVIT